MPFYEYECSKCRYYVEVLQKISDPPLKKCPSCGKSALRKLVSAPVFRLKGSGWYETDFKSDQEGRRNLAGADKDAPAADTAPKDASPKDAPAKDAAQAGSAEGAKGGAATATADTAKPAAASKPSRRASRKSVRLKAKRAAARPPSRRPKRRGGR
jgi:putative FmdB family regulatory protein